ncbi:MULTISPECIES: TIGR04165 family Cys-rich peptide [Methanothermobacter]|jgi:Cys-rich peptide (TIGR04165 family)|uniref:Cys-rich peptide (TIGR04165 family) n=1 Tax=Methanothermobacter defluvii TaxID=49339 RepID=A0A371NC74_9EURY|nr:MULTISPECIES: TIGR04165 family Cys-rich peptide [Methanothermobacter]MBC7111104.1 TIGR04165 family Cys-rich peptide [Methanothermobacter sp.]MDI6818352.1 TIGR04165 family Cys-rich peptide [Methanothermobacter thermautotrophicus]MDK2874633.1 hypothetical protein [Methanothermobacter sp.]MDN5373763.1 hypothetical protein [Methanothermobacter sp.]NLU03725.1 TIGR04165 family Cys-rich peptide [Methanothermobacter sp.]
MKMEEFLSKCPVCGCRDKVVKRRFMDEHKSRTSMKEIVCEKCGHIFETAD